MTRMTTTLDAVSPKAAAGEITASTATGHRHNGAASLLWGMRDLWAMGAAKQGKIAIQITQITQIKSQIAQIRIVWRSAQDSHSTPREAHSIPFRVICDLICVICVELAYFPPPSRHPRYAHVNRRQPPRVVLP